MVKGTTPTSIGCLFFSITDYLGDVPYKCGRVGDEERL